MRKTLEFNELTWESAEKQECLLWVDRCARKMKKKGLTIGRADEYNNSKVNQQKNL